MNYNGMVVTVILALACLGFGLYTGAEINDRYYRQRLEQIQDRCERKIAV